MCDRARASLHDIANWFPNGDGTYIRVFYAYKPTHALPTFITDKMVL